MNPRTTKGQATVVGHVTQGLIAIGEAKRFHLQELAYSSSCVVNERADERDRLTSVAKDARGTREPERTVFIRSSWKSYTDYWQRAVRISPRFPEGQQRKTARTRDRRVDVLGGGASKDQRHALRGRYKTRGKKKRKKITNDRSIRTQQHVNRITIVLGRFDAKRGEVTTAESTCTERESLDTTLLPATTNTARIVKLPIFSEKFSPRESETPRARWRVLSRKRRENVFSAALPPAPRHVWHTTLATRPPVRRVMFRTNGRRRRTTF